MDFSGEEWTQHLAVAQAVDRGLELSFRFSVCKPYTLNPRVETL